MEMTSSHTHNFSKAFVSVSMVGFLFLNSQASPEYLAHLCGSNTSTYFPNSTFQTNLNLLLSSLSSNATRIRGFYNLTIGLDPPNVAYGLFLCRGDVTTNICRDCVLTASKEIIGRCPVEKSAVIWYDVCMLRYANQSFFSTVTETPFVEMSNTRNITEATRFQQLLSDLVIALAIRASEDQSENNQFVKRFETGEANFTSLQKLYVMVQCTQDIADFDCNRCLQVAIRRLRLCCSGKQGGMVLLQSCNIRYETYLFYNSTAVAPPPMSLPPPPTPTSLTRPNDKGKFSSQTIAAIVAPIGGSVVLFAICYLIRRAKETYDATEEENVRNEIITVESLQFDLRTIEAATNNFANNNKIGEGGFGMVYKGVFANGQEIAVKRQSKTSGQGEEEFKNEVVLVAKLQHRHLVRLLGFCLEREEKILIYEYVPNKSLDYFLFDPEKRGELDWSRRYKIIRGIAKGMLYLHEDSRLKIIHRDLKASNILLDADMNPKVSDFGMARVFSVDQTQENTSRIVGTFGYMAPEYAMHGHFSVKTDVFSFGVLVLEIISGMKNTCFYQSNLAEDLLCYAWKLWGEGKPLELVDPNLTDSYSKNEVIRCIHIGLLCVQEDVDARPSMASIVLMLRSYLVTPPFPQQPPFFIHGRIESNTPNGLEFNQFVSCSVDESYITEVHPR